MIRADSPIYLSTMADATTLRKVALMLLANARANKVLPVPGGPYNKTPLGAFKFQKREKLEGVFRSTKSNSRAFIAYLDSNSNEELRVGER